MAVRLECGRRSGQLLPGGSHKGAGECFCAARPYRVSNVGRLGQ